MHTRVFEIKTYGFLNLLSGKKNWKTRCVVVKSRILEVINELNLVVVTCRYRLRC
jgi:hypothetical protein